jgi:hypothetical protein
MRIICAEITKLKDGDCNGRDDPVVDRAAQNSRCDAEHHRDGNREQGCCGGELKRAQETRADELCYRHIVGIGDAEVAGRKPAQPPDEPQ